MSAITMSSGFGNSGQNRRPEKVPMKPSESILQQNRRNMLGTIPPPLLSRRAQEPPLGGKTEPPAWCRTAPPSASGGTGRDSGLHPPGYRGLRGWTGPANSLAPQAEGAAKRSEIGRARLNSSH